MAKKLGQLLARKPVLVNPTLPARTRFAPSPTGFMHLGSMRTAVYNYLLAKSTKGQFLLRLEDTDQKRLVKGAEDNIYKSLEWAGIQWDEGPLVGGSYGPYRQSERSDIYAKYADQLLATGQAYRCFCSKDRLNRLTESARALHPPSTASYDRKCAHIPQEESDDRAHSGEPYIVRFKSPGKHAPFTDLLHGELSIDVQTNPMDVRFDDFTLIKSDGLPTYHLANVVDDHLMKITHVIRGEEWLPSTPKHIALYSALGLTAPNFVHIPLLTTTGGRKLSKRKSDQGILDYASQVLPEAFVNFVALLGWSPAKQAIGQKMSEVMDLPELVSRFSLDHLTKGNVQVDESKLFYFDQAHFKRQLADPSKRETLIRLCSERARNSPFCASEGDTERMLDIIGNHVASVGDFALKVNLLAEPKHDSAPPENGKEILEAVLAKIDAKDTFPTAAQAKQIMAVPYPKKDGFQALRYALLDGQSGISVAEALQIFSANESRNRIEHALKSYP